MPYKSEAQRRFFHTATARHRGISAATVAEHDRESKGKKIPIEAIRMASKRRKRRDG